MPKEKVAKKGKKLRHAPLSNEIEKPVGKLRPPRQPSRGGDDDDDYYDENDNYDVDNAGNEMEEVDGALGAKIAAQAREQQRESKKVGGGSSKPSVSFSTSSGAKSSSSSSRKDAAYDSDEYDDDVEEEDVDDDDGADMVEIGGDYVSSTGLTDAEEAVVNKFLNAGRTETRTLADIIMEKIREKEMAEAEEDDESSQQQQQRQTLTPKVIEVYTAVGKMLHNYKSGKLPKALKMLPHLRNWEDVLWLTRPDQWSPTATYACTRIFASNLNVKMAQRFLNLVLLERCRDDIRQHKKLNYHLYMAMKKALFKPAAFYKGFLLPLCQSGDCTLREAVIYSSVLAKVSIPGDHSAAALLRLAEMPYSGSTSLFIRILLNKKYALPRRVIEALVVHFCSFENESRTLPVIWHQSLLVFAQRYKKDLDDSQRERLKRLLRSQNHQITQEVRREIFFAEGGNHAAGSGNENTMKY